MAQEYITLFFSNRIAREAGAGLTNLLVLLNQAKAELESESEEAPMQSPAVRLGKVFIGHGRSLVWLQLKSFLNEQLQLTCDEFNAEAVAGRSTTDRLAEMLDEAAFAFLVMTAEDTHADDSAHARENVIHEAGLFQGRLGFKRAIILLEKGCTVFSNIHGLTYIPFPKDNLAPAFEEIRRVLEREHIYRSAKESGIATAPHGQLCPKCFKPSWCVESSAPDQTFGIVGVSRRVYKCNSCGFTEIKMSK